MLRLILAWLTAGPLDRILASVDRSVDNATERERIRTEAVAAFVNAHVGLANSSGCSSWCRQVFWFGSVCVYSVLWCRGCAFPQDWTIAALPPPLDEWMGAIVASLFIGKAGETLIGRLRGWKSK